MKTPEKPLENAVKPGAWWIAGSCFWINFFLFCVFRSSGVLYLAMVTSWGCTYEEASWPMTLASGVSAMTCLPVGFLSHYVPLRILVMSGICITCFSISICFLATSIYFINVFVGIFHGIGIGFVTGLLPVIISDYFGRRRAAATGLSYAGAGIGAFIFPLIFQILLDSYSLQKSLLIMGGMNFCAIAGALLLTPLTAQNGLQISRTKRDSNASESSHLKSPSSHSTRSLTGSSVEASTACGTGCYDDGKVGECLFHVSERKCQDDTGGTLTSSSLHPRSHEVFPSSPGKERHEDDRREFALLNERSSQERQEVSSQEGGEDGEKRRQNERRNQLDFAPRETDEGIQVRNKMMDMISMTGKRRTSWKEGRIVSEMETSISRKLSNEIEEEEEKEENEEKGSLLNKISSQILSDAKILTRRHFFLITTTYVSYIMASVTFIMILPDFAVDIGLSKTRGVFLLSLFAITDLLGRLLPGWLPFFFVNISNKSLYASSIIIMGFLFITFPILLSTSTFDMPLESKYNLLVILTLSCGFVSGCQMILPPVVVADTLGSQNTAVAFGLCNFVYGFLSFSRPFLFRHIKDGNIEGKYQTVFLLFGGIALLSGFLWVIELVVMGVVRRRKLSSREEA